MSDLSEALYHGQMDFGYDEHGNKLTGVGSSSSDSDDEREQGSLSHSDSDESDGASSNSSLNLDDGKKKNQQKKKKKKVEGQLQKRVHWGEEDDEDSDIDSSNSDAKVSEGNRSRSESVSSSSSSTSSSSSSSSSSDDDSAEIIIGEDPTQAIDEPLVNPQDLVQQGSAGRRRDPRQTFYLTAGDVGESGGSVGAGPLLITDKKTPAEAKAIFMETLATARSPCRLRNVVLIGSLHHGKTSLLSMWINEDHDSVLSPPPSSGAAVEKSQAYRKSVDEEERGITIKTHVTTLVVSGAKLQQSSHLLTCIDTPGHPDFISEVVGGMRLADAAVLCVDAVESLLSSGEALVKRAVQEEHLPIILVITKVDRLIVELKLPPADAYRKLRLIVETVNNVIKSYTPASAESYLVSPENGSVCFSSAALGFCFSLETFALKYSAVYPKISNPTLLSQKFWGQFTFDKGQFKPITNPRQKHSFVQFILEPIYKIISHAACGGKAVATLSASLADMPRSPLASMVTAIRHFCGRPSFEGMDILLSVLPPPSERSRWLLSRYALDQVLQCSGENSESVPTSKEGDITTLAVAPLIRLHKEGSVAAVVRVVRGTLEHAAPLAVVDDGCGDEEPCYAIKVERLFVYSNEGLLPVQRAHEGQVVFVTGIGERAGKHLVLVGGPSGAAALKEGREKGEEEDEDDDDDLDEATEKWLSAIRPPRFLAEPPLLHVDLELKDPQRLQVFQDGLHTLQRTTPGIDVHRRESGQFTIRASGELHFDAVLRELRQVLCPGVRIAISPPYVTFAETVRDEEGLLAISGSRRSAVGCTSGTLPAAFTAAIESGSFPSELLEMNLEDKAADEQRRAKLAAIMRETYAFDALDAQNLIALGPDPVKGPSVLLDDTLNEEREISKSISAAHLSALIRGFRAAVSAGPLVGETVRGVAMRIITADLDPHTSQAVVLANARSAARQSLLGARPRLLEPTLQGELVCSAEDELIAKVKDIITQRRGVTLNQFVIPVTSLVRIMVLVPAIDSFGLETQIRMATHGQCFPLFRFHSWDVVPGDPYDNHVHVGPLEPAQGHELSRDFVLKTRFRKGLSQQLLTGDL